jgi:hypothetical protein
MVNLLNLTDTTATHTLRAKDRSDNRYPSADKSDGAPLSTSTFAVVTVSHATGIA